MSLIDCLVGVLEIVMSLWSQEGIGGELAENVAQFVSSLPKTVRQIEEEPISQHI